MMLLALSTTTSIYAAESKIAGCLLTFKTKGSPVLVTIEGKSESPCTGNWTVEGADTKKSKVTMDLTKLNTGLPLRNKHLRENYLHTDKFPIATLSDINATDIANQVAGKASGRSPFTGMLELHGKKAEIKGSYSVKGGKEYSGDFEIDLPDFGIERPSFMGVKVVDKVFITFSFKAE